MAVLQQLARLSSPRNQTDKLIADATNDNNWGPTSVELNELSHLTSKPKDLRAVCKRLDKRLRARNSTKVLKSLTVVYFLVQTGSKAFLDWLYERKYLIRALSVYQVDTKHSEQMVRTCNNIRHKASEISKLLDDDKLLKEKRDHFANLRQEMKLPTPRSSLDAPQSPVLGVRKAHSLDIYNRGDLISVIDRLSSSPPLHENVVFSSSEYPDYSRTKLSNIVEIEE